jgi:hypothetical protein
MKKGWYREEGINLTTTAFRSAADMVAPMASGQLDVGGGSVSAGFYNAYERGIKLRVVADKASSQPGYAVNKCLIAKKHIESGRFKQLSDLKGMKVATNAPGNSGWGSLWGYLRAAGIGYNDIDTLDLGYPEHVLALQNGAVDVNDAAASFQAAVIDILRDRTDSALSRFLREFPDLEAPTLVVAGGVAANFAIGSALTMLAENRNIRIHIPPPKYCTDNAAMIGWAGLERLRLGLTDGMDFAPRPRWPLDASATPVHNGKA